MQRKSQGKAKPAAKSHEPYLRRGHIIRGKSLIPGRKEPTFPPFLRIEEKPVTFRERSGERSREEREGIVIQMMEMARRNRKLITILIPSDVYDNPKTAVFHAGWTLVERDGEIRTRQLVVFQSGEAFPVGRSDQGVVCIALRASLSAWDGHTTEQSRSNAA